jgi:dihydroorotase
VEIIKQAKMEGLKVTFDVTPHHLLLTEEKLVSFNPAFKMKPPLRTKKDTEALEKALQEKLVDVIATDHAPHPPEEKEVEFERAAFGVVGLDTALSLIYQNFVLSGKLTYTELASLMSLKPAEILGLKRSLEPGATAYLTIFDPDFEWVYQKEEDGLCYNSPFLGEKMKGKAFGVISGGKLLFWEGKLLG